MILEALEIDIFINKNTIKYSRPNYPSSIPQNLRYLSLDATYMLDDELWPLIQNTKKLEHLVFKNFYFSRLDLSSKNLISSSYLETIEFSNGEGIIDFPYKIFHI